VQAAAFAGALILLLVGARSGTSQGLLVLLLSLYLVAATVWVRGQYADSLVAQTYDPPVLVWWLALLITAVGVVLAILSVVWHPNWLLHHGAGTQLTGVILAYFGLGMLITIWRSHQYRRNDAPTIPMLWLGAGVIAAYLGVGVLGHWNVTWTLLLIAGGLLLAIPIGLQLASARAIRALAGENTQSTVHVTDSEPTPERPHSSPSGRWRTRRGLRLLFEPITKPDGHQYARWRTWRPVWPFFRLDPGLVARRRQIVGFGGLLVFVASLVVASVWAHSLLLALILVVLGGFVVAIASSTQADIAAVFVVVAVLGITPHQPALPAALNPWHLHPAVNESKKPDKQVLVAIGDSYMSGEGASVYYQNTDEASGDQCRRSPTAWAAIAGQIKSEFDGLAFLACSGASTYNVNLNGPQTSAQRGEPSTQLSQYVANDVHHSNGAVPFTPKLVVVTLGGNDAGFGTIGEMCLAPGNCGDRWPSRLWTNSLPQVQAALTHTYDQIAQTFPDTPVLLVGYPDPIYEPSNHKCGQVTLKYPERKFVKQFVASLDQTMVKAMAHRANFYYMPDSLTTLQEAHLQLCDPANGGRPGLNFIGVRSMQGTPEERFDPQNWIHNSLHPNERGHLAILSAFEDWLQKHPKAKAAAVAYAHKQYKQTPGPAALATSRQASTVAIAPCSIVDGTPDNCTQKGRIWALKQLSGSLMPWGLTLGLLTVAGAWAAGVALFGWRRRVALDER
jgi:lysophospholipase L1-like esterase